MKNYWRCLKRWIFHRPTNNIAIDIEAIQERPLFYTILRPMQGHNFIAIRHTAIPGTV